MELRAPEFVDSRDGVQPPGGVASRRPRRKEGREERLPTASPTLPQARLLAPAYPTLWPQMLLPRGRPLPYPFNDLGLRYFYFARNGIYALAQLWGLAEEEILFPAYFHGVELEALLAADVRPRFYPVGYDLRVEVEKVVARLRPETRAIYLIHYAGFPGPVEELAELCRQRNLLLIEDCALALFSCLGDRPLGSFGDAAIFCLYKTLPVPNGGVLVVRRGGAGEWPRTQAPSLASTLANAASSLSVNCELRSRTGVSWLLKALRAAGKGVRHGLKVERVETGTQHFDRAHAGLGMSRLSHWILTAQDASFIVERRRHNYQHLLARLGHLSPPVWGELAPGVCPLFYPLRTRNKQRLAAWLAAHGVEAVEFWSQTHPAVPPGTFPEVDELRRTVLELPCHQDLTLQDMGRIADHVSELLPECD